MEPNSQAEAVHRTGVPTYIVESVVALLSSCWASWSSSAAGSSARAGPPTAPAPATSLLHRLHPVHRRTGILVQGLMNKNHEIFVDSEQLKRVLSVLLPALVYVLAVQFIGLYVGSAIYIALFMIILGKYSKVKSVIVALVVVTLFFMMFEVWFKVPLFKECSTPCASWATEPRPARQR